MRKLILVAFVASTAIPTFAAFTAVSSSAALGANDFIDLNQFGVDFSAVADGTVGTTNGGISFTIASCDDISNDDNRGMEMRTEGSSWSGVFTAGDRVLWHQGDNNPNSYVRIRFASNVLGVGTTGQSNNFGDFQLQAFCWDTYPNLFIGGSATDGNNTAAAAYTGGYSDVGFNEVYFTAYMRNSDGTLGNDTAGFGIGRIDVKVVPEPATMATLGLGAAALLRRRRK